MAGIRAVLVGAAAAFLLNDSGIVFGATMIGMTVLVLLYSVMEAGAECPHPDHPHSGKEKGANPLCGEGVVHGAR